MTQDEAIVHVAEEKRNGRRVAFTYGCFHLLHPGHIRRLEYARSLGDILVVAISSGARGDAPKWEDRPVVPPEERAEILCALQAVDVVVIFETDTLRKLIARLSPDVLATIGNAGPDEIARREEVMAAGGQVVSIPAVPGYSTADILSRIREPGLRDSAMPSTDGANKT